MHHFFFLACSALTLTKCRLPGVRDRMARAWMTAMLAAGVAACGGGGNDADEHAASTLPPLPGSSLVTAVPLPDYPPDSQARLAFDLINAERERCGFGKVAQNKALDAAAQDHFHYVQLNGPDGGHTQTPGKPGFTAATPNERAQRHGYRGTAGENIGWLQPGGRTGQVFRGVRDLFTAPYHALGLLYGFREVGIAAVTPQPLGRTEPLVVAVGWPDGVFHQAVKDLSTYPCEGTSGVQPVSTGERPSPFPSEPTARWGQPIILMGRTDWPGGDVHVTQVAITGPNGSVALKALYGEGNTRDPNGFCKGPYTCVIPEPLQPTTRYQVALAGTHLGQRFTRSFSFTTGAAGAGN